MKRLVLAGAGHAHARVLVDWAREPLRGVELVVVSPHALAPYSGMVPGWLAGRYRLDEMVIDFAALCAAAGCRWVQAEMLGLDPDRRELRLSTGEVLGYDLLSLNVGSTLRPPDGAGGHVLAMRPLSELPTTYETVLADWRQHSAHTPWTVTAVGGGPAGVESLLAVLARLRQLRPERAVHGGLVTQDMQLLPTVSSGARRAAARALGRAGVTLRLGSTWCDTMARTSQLVLWATGAQAHDWQRDVLRRGRLAVSEQGFVRIDAHLRSVSHPHVFATGDCAHWEAGTQPLPKAGVVAVRMAPVLSHNLRVVLGAPGRVVPYRPQRQFLVLMATGDGRAIASRGPFSAAGAWAWRLKDYIDRRFVTRHTLPSATAVSKLSTASNTQERDPA
ncbi:FAD-dependent oxidoreductase [Piscinibacter sp. HJYY11]|uniref:FAD-dependent oxidoreductase n=1 Tax=Piscinibacter sp. HJYY11 TaxID=2801333 RepID=UPI0019202ADF|nr:FAD-dependent oxidoreductase [Piscinibacter sp. HJYY11]MBL0726602.1 FAD-dependent oxidoreductase [Piscinibacter sp. HJYY11]